MRTPDTAPAAAANTAFSSSSSSINNNDAENTLRHMRAVAHAPMVSKMDGTLLLVEWSLLTG